MNYPTEKDDLKKSDKNNLAIAVNVLMCYKLKMDIFPFQVSKHNSNCERQVCLFFKIPNGE